MVKDSIILKAYAFADAWHAGQKRKYTGEPYIVHPVAVANIVATVPHDLNMLAAAYLHDTIEDTSATYENVLEEFGLDIATLVMELTDKSTAHHGNREMRKEFDRLNLSIASARAQTIKLADLINNTSSIVKHDTKFAKVYLREKALLLDVLTRGDITLWRQAKDLLDQSITQLELETL